MANLSKWRSQSELGLLWSRTSSCGLEAYINTNAKFVAAECDRTKISVVTTCIGATGSCQSGTTEIPLPEGAWGVSNLAIDDSGRFVTFLIVQEQAFVPVSRTYLYDSCNGVSSGCTPQTVPICLNVEGALSDGNYCSGTITPDGQYFVLYTSGTNIPTNGSQGGSYIASNPLK